MYRSLLALPVLVGMSVLGPSPLVRAETPTVLAQATSQIYTSSNNESTLYLNHDVAYEQSLRVTSPTRISGVSVPAGAVVRGQFEPAEGGLVYVANGVEFGGQRYGVRARSQVIHDVKDPREVSGGAILGDAAIGAAGGLLLSEIFGDASFGAAAGGAAAGVIVGNVTAQRIVVIEPGQEIELEPYLLD